MVIGLGAGMRRRSSGTTILFLANLILGLYFLNKGFNFFSISTFITPAIDNGIIIAGGALLIVGGLMSLMRRPAPIY